MGWRDELTTFAEKSFDHPSWGVSHCRRIHALSTALAEAEGMTLDDDVAFAVAYLHDAGAFEPWGRGGADQQAGSTRCAAETLPRIGFPGDRTGLVLDIIREHRFDDDPGPRAEAQTFHDADVLDFLGTIGVTRLLALVRLEDWVPDVRSAIEVAEGFTRDLPDKLVLDSARRLAERRAAEARDFLGRLREETAEYRDL